MIERWALISGLKGDLETYELIQKNLKKIQGDINLFVLGDMVGAVRNCDALIDRLINPLPGDFKPQCIYGWWEDQLLAERGYRGEQKADALRLNEGESVVKDLVDAVDPYYLNWLASLEFGFVELDCGLIHGSSKDIGDSLTKETPPLILLDRLTRLGVNRLFTARSAQQFHLELTDAVVNSYVKDLGGNRKQEQRMPKRGVIGIGAGAYYTLYDVGSDKTHFLNVLDQPKSAARGFG